MILPGSKIGIIGGGQLGKMLAISANTMGYYTIVLDANAEAPAFAVANEKIIGKLDDYQSIEQLVKKADVITYEFENIDATIIATLQQMYQNIPQGHLPLYLSQNRIREKEALVKAQLPIAPYLPITDIMTEFTNVAQQLGFPFMLKTVEGGYDGKGQVMIHRAEDVHALTAFADTPCVAETYIHYDYECSIIAVRSINDEIRCFPVAQNTHKNGILYQTSVDNQQDEKIIATLNQHITNFMHIHNIYGILTFEAFVKGEHIYINEMAPRPHNSGHYTIEGCATSQFEQHIRAICGLPLGATTLLARTTMFNILGQHQHRLFNYLNKISAHAHLHLYGKKDYLTNRKMGHITFTNATAETLADFEKQVLLMEE